MLVWSWVIFLNGAIKGFPWQQRSTIFISHIIYMIIFIVCVVLLRTINLLISTNSFPSNVWYWPVIIRVNMLSDPPLFPSLSYTLYWWLPLLTPLVLMKLTPRIVTYLVTGFKISGTLFFVYTLYMADTHPMFA